MYFMKDMNRNSNLSEINMLKKENEDLKRQIHDLQNRLNWVIAAKNEIYDKYIKKIINNSKKK